MNNHFTASDVFDYIQQWEDTENWSDFNIILDKSFIFGYELACNHLVNHFGCIDPELCDPEFKNLELEIIKISENYNKNTSEKEKKELFNLMFKDINTFHCNECNHVSFISKGNTEIYKDELAVCWACKSKDITKS